MHGDTQCNFLKKLRQEVHSVVGFGHASCCLTSGVMFLVFVLYVAFPQDCPAHFVALCV